MPASRFDLVVFDWDGTLYDSAGAIAAAIQSVAADLGLPVPDDARARHVIGLGLADAMAYALPDLAARDMPRVIEAYRRHWARFARTTILFDGALELVATLHRRGHVLAIATGKSRAGLAQALDETGLASYFTASRTADVTEPKPHPAMLRELTAELGVAPARTLMIGDTSHDLQMAAAAGVPAVGVTYGAHPRESLESCPSLALLDSVDELGQWLTTNA